MLTSRKYQSKRENTGSKLRSEAKNPDGYSRGHNWTAEQAKNKKNDVSFKTDYGERRQLKASLGKQTTIISYCGLGCVISNICSFIPPNTLR